MDLGADLPVTIVIKAPNQRIEDQTVDCMLGWTVKKLKEHLKSVYPNKPVYWVGPVVGGVLAALVYEYIFAASASFSRTKKFVLRHRKPAEKPTPANQEDLNNSKAGLIEVQTTDGEGEAVAVEMEKIDLGEDKKEEEGAADNKAE